MDILKYGPKDKYVPKETVQSEERCPMPSLYYGRGDDDGSLLFPAEVEKMFLGDELREDEWAKLMKDAISKFPKLEGTDALPIPAGNPPLANPIPILDFAHSHATLDAIKNDAQLTIVKSMSGKIPSYSLLVVAPKGAEPDQMPDPKTYQVYMVAEKPNTEIKDDDWILAPGQCDWLMDAPAKKALGMARTGREDSACQCEWTSSSDMVIPQIREGVDAHPQTWSDHLTAHEKEGHVEYTISHHKMQTPSGNPPVAARGDTCPLLNETYIHRFACDPLSLAS
jgi:hypothetical protein